MKTVRNVAKLVAVVALATIGSLDASTALAATSTANLSVTATVANSCTIGTTAVAFGAYDGVGANATSDLDAAGQVTVTCTLAGSDVTVTLGQGANAGGGSTDAAPVRQMASGANRMAYSLFSDTGRTTVWGNTAGTGKATTPTGSAVNIPVYGRVTAGQSLPAGSYADTVVATVTF